MPQTISPSRGWFEISILKTPLLLIRTGCLIPEIAETECNREIMCAHGGDHGLEVIAAFSGDSNLLILDLRGDFQFGVPDELSDLLGCGAFDSLFDFDDLAGMPEWGNVGFTFVHAFEVNIPLCQFADDDLHQGSHLEFVFGTELDFVFIKLNLRLASFEVEAVCDLLFRLVHSVLDFHRIHF